MATETPAATTPAGAARLAARAWQVVRHRELSPRAFERVALASVWALVLVIVSGAAVRLTGSGLGCPDWPSCTASQVVAPWQFHAWVEFGNRLINAAVSVAAVGAVGAALIRRPRRRDLTWLSLGLLAGLLAEVVLGGLTVEHGLAPGFVTAHFLLAIVFLADAVVLHHRSRVPDGPTRAVRLVSREQLVLGRLLVVATGLVVVLGTIVTSTGPHGGAPSTPRYAFSLHDVAELHGTSAELLLAFAVLTLWSLARSGAPAPVIRRGELVLVALVAQGAIGYIQYFTGVPAGLVELHVAGATALAIAVLAFHLGLHRRVPLPAAPAAPAGVRVAERAPVEAGAPGS